MSPRAACRLETLGFEDAYDFVAGKAGWMAHGLPTVGDDAATPRIGKHARKVAICLVGDRVDEVRDRARNERHDMVVVVNNDGVVLGVLRDETLSESPLGAIAQDVMTGGPSTYRPDVSIDEMRTRMRKYDFQSAIVTAADGVLIGVFEDLQYPETGP